jgi:hypothetical protein
LICKAFLFSQVAQIACFALLVAKNPPPLSAYFGHASRSPSTLAWQSAYILTVSVAQASTSRPLTPVSRSRPGQLESKFAGIGIAGDLGVEDAQPI